MPTLTVDQVIVRPLITEKNTDLMEQDQYTFEVATVANKIQIREAVEKLFNVRVKAVNTMNVKGSRRSIRVISSGRESTRPRRLGPLPELSITCMPRIRR